MSSNPRPARSEDRPARAEDALHRRDFFARASDGLYGAALAYLAQKELFGGAGLGLPAASAAEATPSGPAPRRGHDLAPKRPHFPARAQAIIQLFQNGGPSQVDLFDPKPILAQRHGEAYYDRIAQDVSSPESAGGLLRSPFQFAQHGDSGIWISDVLPQLHRHADKLAVIRSMYNSHPNHEPALFKIHSGRLLPGLPALGSWVVYGLGSENQSLPAYVVLDDPGGLPVNGVQSWQAGYLPPIYQGTRLRSTGAPLLNLRPEVEPPPEITRLSRDLLSRLDQLHRRDRPGHLELDARIASYELAARMQLEATEALDLSRETQATLDLYGVGPATTDNYARRLLMARRLVERGVRFVQVFINGQSWDNHNNLERSLRSVCQKTDQPTAALLQDLEQRGLLDSTLVVWGGEFGRLPIAQIPRNGDLSSAGRDHGPRGFSLWMAGGGIKGGTTYGATDEIGFAAQDNPVSIADWHATMLHLLGLRHQDLTYLRNGLRERLTETPDARVVQEILL